MSTAAKRERDFWAPESSEELREAAMECSNSYPETGVSVAKRDQKRDFSTVMDEN